jgi:glutamate formiminotransferase
VKQIVECVPNFSEGRDQRKIDLIAEEIGKVRGVSVLDVDMSASYNRSVVTFVGTPETIRQAAFLGIAEAVELIDMSQHQGGHPRLGACDVCPFVPIQDVTMADCIALANQLGQQVAEELALPVYLYGEAAKSPDRKNLARIRAGEYEGLAEKLKYQVWKPDYGPAVFSKRSGALVIGAREALIAFNVNLRAQSKRAVDIIAGRIRESGWTAVSEDGKKVRCPGVFKEVRALGVSLEEYGLYQVSTNLTNYKVTPPHVVFEMVKRLSPGLGEVLGSEIVGLVPKAAIFATGRFYSPTEQSENRLIQAAVDGLELSSLKEFDARKKIIEYMIEEDQQC